MRVELPLRHRDMDALGHVNQAVYHELLEELRAAFFRRALPDLPFTGYVLAHVELDYRREVRIEDRVLTGECHAARLGRSSVELDNRLMLRDGTVAVEGRAVLVAWDEDAPARTTPHGRRARRAATPATPRSEATMDRPDGAPRKLSASYSLTLRVLLDDRPGTFAKVAGAIGSAGADPRRDRPRARGRRPRRARRDRRLRGLRARRAGGRGRARRRGRDGRQRLGPHVPDAPGREDRDRAEDLRQDPRRPLDGLHAGRRARQRGDRRGPREGVGADGQGQHDRDRLRRLGGARPRRHRPARGDAGDGGQGPALQGAGRRRRLPALPRDPGRRHDRGVRQGGRRRASAASTWRTSRRRAASRSSGACGPSSTSPSSTTTSTGPRSWCSPRC